MFVADEEQNAGRASRRRNAPIFGLQQHNWAAASWAGRCCPSSAEPEHGDSRRPHAPRRIAAQSHDAAQIAATPAFDGRELRRWGISEDRLQPGSVVLFREPTAWQRYRPQIIAGVTFASVRRCSSIALLASLVKRRRRAERSLRVNEEASACCRYRAGHDLERRSRQAVHERQSCPSRFHRPTDRGGIGRGWTERRSTLMICATAAGSSRRRSTAVSASEWSARLRRQ